MAAKVVQRVTAARRTAGVGLLVFLVAFGAGVMTGPPAGAAGPFTTTDLGSLGAGSSQATALNDSGQVVGWAIAADGNTHAVAWAPGGPTVDLGNLGGVSSYAADVNDSGTVA